MAKSSIHNILDGLGRGPDGEALYRLPDNFPPLSPRVQAALAASFSSAQTSAAPTVPQAAAPASPAKPIPG